MAIQSFRCKDTQRLFETGSSRRFRSIARVANRKLVQLETSATLESLKAPPGNRLEKLVGDREGQHSIRVNDKWRVCFRWTDQGPADVEIVDYHR
jgi:proteic killer suppression protein